MAKKAQTIKRDIRVLQTPKLWPMFEPSLEQEQLGRLERALHQFWNLGRNCALVWSPRERGIDVLFIPNFVIANYAPSDDATSSRPRPKGARPVTTDSKDQAFMESILKGAKMVTGPELKRIAKMVDYKAKRIDLPIERIEDLGLAAIDAMVSRYGISYIEDRAVALFDIVNFSLYSPVEQVAQLNSLAYSVNAAHARLLTKRIDISFARSTTGDGFYTWNRDRSIQANVNLYHFMHLVLADNAIARRKATNNATPLLRACFHVGGHYEFYQAEGLSPTIYSYIVGEVTIELARLIARAAPGQVVVGDFRAPMLDSETGQVTRLDAPQFIERTQKTLSSLKGLQLSGEAIDKIQCYLTGERSPGGEFSTKKYKIFDKHGITRDAYNAKINIYRKNADPVFLGLQDTEIAKYEAEQRAAASVQ